tara:strand:+ start:13201 stop:13566 length:366 start_codon:yes stop_codon:yes gene_type:complete
MNPKKHKAFKKGIAEEVGVHQSVVDDFISFYYDKLRYKLSNLEYPRIQVDGLGTFVIRKSKLNKAIMKNKSLLGNIAKRTYNGFAKSEDIKKNIVQMDKAMEQIEKNILSKKDFKEQKHGN